MSDFFETIGKRLRNINVEEINNQRNELRQISQEIILSGLAKNGFFDNAVFMGGTALRLIHGLNRYSEDLDFRFLQLDRKFNWMMYYSKLNEHIKKYGGYLKFFDESKGELKRVITENNKLIENIDKNKIINVQWAKNKAGSFETINVQLDISYKNVKPEIENKKLLFPEEYQIKVFDIHSLFAGKIKAILTRRDRYGNEVNEGRDWFDLNWLVKKGVEPNFNFLYESLEEDKKYKGRRVLFNEIFIKNELFNRARILNFDEMNDKIEAFTTKDDRLILDHNNVKETINNLGKGGYLIKNSKTRI